jgi:hypothetical protein
MKIQSIGSQEQKGKIVREPWNEEVKSQRYVKQMNSGNNKEIGEREREMKWLSTWEEKSLEEDLLD